MSSENKNAMNIAITGDITIDWNLAKAIFDPSRYKRWTANRHTHASIQYGGAVLLANLVDQIARGVTAGDKYHLYTPLAPEAPIDPMDPSFNHSYAIWSVFKEGASKAWRLARFVGISNKSGNTDTQEREFPIIDDSAQLDLIIIDDAALGFRDDSHIWPISIKDSSNQPWVLLKMSKPLCEGPLWEELLDNHLEHLIVLTTVSDLRANEVQISKGLSWERTAQDVYWELIHNPQINDFSRCASVVVSFGAAGAIIYSHIPASPGSEPYSSHRCQLVFDPAVIEGVWEMNHPGEMIGYTSCLAAGIAGQIIRLSDSPDIIPGIQAGLEALRDLHLGGYKNHGTPSQPELKFPLERIAQCLAKPTNQFAVVEVQDPILFLDPSATRSEAAPDEGYWSILHQRYQGDLLDICHRIVMDGAESVLADVPQGKFGGLFTVDRQEIESYRSISTLTAEYLSQIRPKRPLSIAVFGPPGSGKSFGITQVAKSLAPGYIQVLEFNLSEFDSADEIGDALHQVRDVNLSGNFPLVFWDEFDSPMAGKSLGWLRYFLAPMQDGAFRQGQLMHPIGPAIFVFAGGTSEKMISFGTGLDEETFKNRKVPDFISRLKGFVNILGPNPQSEADRFYMVRRAILLRSILWRNARHLFHPQDGVQQPNIDKGVLRAFLQTRFYQHGIRSMESIVAMSQLAGQIRYERSSLPPEAQLDLHVDGQEFLALVQQLELTPETLDRLAISFHQFFCDQLQKQGYVYGLVIDERTKTHSSLKEFHDLPDDEKEQNREAVRHIHAKLSASGFIMIPARSNEPPFEFPGTFLEKLAIMEHERWMQMKFSQGWQAGTETDKEKKIHKDLVPWDQLSNTGREKDKDFVLAIPGILAEAGYTVVKLRPVKSAP